MLMCCSFECYGFVGVFVLNLFLLILIYVCYYINIFFMNCGKSFILVVVWGLLYLVWWLLDVLNVGIWE